jgi:putative acetyltransferase
MIVIRPERPDQPEITALLGALDRYLASLYPPEANHILDVQALLAPEVSFMVARRDGRAVGTAACRRMPGEAATGGEAYGEIKRMYVVPAERGQRIAEQLLQALEERLRDDGLGQALLETGRDQIEAVRLYERCGYARRGPFGGYEDNGLSLFLAKRVSR